MTHVRIVSTRQVVPKIRLFMHWGIVVVMVFFIGCSSTLRLSSSWNNDRIVVDGSQADWGNETVYLKEPGLTLGLKNDQDFLYVCMVSRDPRLPFHVGLLGLTLWVKPNGDDERSFGLRFPLGSEEKQSRKSPGTSDFDDIQKLLGRISEQIEILGPGEKQGTRLSKMEATGIKVESKHHGALLVYEAMIPLEKSGTHLYAIGVGDATSVSVELKMGELKGEATTRGAAERRRGPPSAEPGRPPDAEAGGPPRTGGPGRSGGPPPKPFDVRVEVRLASKDPSAAM